MRLTTLRSRAAERVSRARGRNSILSHPIRYYECAVKQRSSKGFLSTSRCGGKIAIECAASFREHWGWIDMRQGKRRASVALLQCAVLLLAGCAARPDPAAVSPSRPDTVRPEAEIAGEAFRKAIALSREGRFVDAVPWYRAAAERGHVDAQFMLGTMYRTGRGVSRDDAAAAYWYQQASIAGNAWAQFSLGTMHIRGEGLPPNPHEGVRLYRLAAAQGHREAQYNLGVLYYNGDGVARDYAEAEGWFSKAARNGDPASQFALGRMYSTPHTGVRLDRVRAHAWYTVAAAADYPGAAEAARGLERKMSAAERASSRATARRFASEIND
ncbi:MAG: sel1 repeat family protein [Rhodospirillales bacterium]|nr:MAG: sel1 repeat family protein [Rhodospirillales bacterium]